MAQYALADICNSISNSPSIDISGLSLPTSIVCSAMSKDGYVCIGLATQVLLLDDNYRAIQLWGEIGDEIGQFASISHVSFSADGTLVYVTDKGNNRVISFDLTGKLQMIYATIDPNYPICDCREAVGGDGCVFVSADTRDTTPLRTLWVFNVDGTINTVYTHVCSPELPSFDQMQWNAVTATVMARDTTTGLIRQFTATDVSQLWSPTTEGTVVPALSTWLKTSDRNGHIYFAKSSMVIHATMEGESIVFQDMCYIEGARSGATLNCIGGTSACLAFGYSDGTLLINNFDGTLIKSLPFQVDGTTYEVTYLWPDTDGGILVASKNNTTVKKYSATGDFVKTLLFPIATGSYASSIRFNYSSKILCYNQMSSGGVEVLRLEEAGTERRLTHLCSYYGWDKGAAFSDGKVLLNDGSKYGLGDLNGNILSTSADNAFLQELTDISLRDGSYATLAIESTGDSIYTENVYVSSSAITDYNDTGYLTSVPGDCSVSDSGLYYHNFDGGFSFFDSSGAISAVGIEQGENYTDTLGSCFMLGQTFYVYKAYDYCFQGYTINTDKTISKADTIPVTDMRMFESYYILADEDSPYMDGVEYRCATSSEAVLFQPTGKVIFIDLVEGKASKYWLGFPARGGDGQPVMFTPTSVMHVGNEYIGFDSNYRCNSCISDTTGNFVRGERQGFNDCFIASDKAIIAYNGMLTEVNGIQQPFSGLPVWFPVPMDGQSVQSSDAIVTISNDFHCGYQPDTKKRFICYSRPFTTKFAVANNGEIVLFDSAERFNADGTLKETFVRKTYDLIHPTEDKYISLWRLGDWMVTEYDAAGNKLVPKTGCSVTTYTIDLVVGNSAYVFHTDNIEEIDITTGEYLSVTPFVNQAELKCTKAGLYISTGKFIACLGKYVHQINPETGEVEKTVSFKTNVTAIRCLENGTIIIKGRDCYYYLDSELNIIELYFGFCPAYAGVTYTNYGIFDYQGNFLFDYRTDIPRGQFKDNVTNRWYLVEPDIKAISYVTRVDGSFNVNFVGSGLRYSERVRIPLPYFYSFVGLYNNRLYYMVSETDYSGISSVDSNGGDYRREQSLSIAATSMCQSTYSFTMTTSYSPLLTVGADFRIVNGKPYVYSLASVNNAVRTVTPDKKVYMVSSSVNKVYTVNTLTTQTIGSTASIKSYNLSMTLSVSLLGSDTVKLYSSNATGIISYSLSDTGELTEPTQYTARGKPLRSSNGDLYVLTDPNANYTYSRISKVNSDGTVQFIADSCTHYALDGEKLYVLNNASSAVPALRLFVNGQAASFGIVEDWHLPFAIKRVINGIVTTDVSKVFASNGNLVFTGSKFSATLRGASVDTITYLRPNPSWCWKEPSVCAVKYNGTVGFYDKASKRSGTFENTLYPTLDVTQTLNPVRRPYNPLTAAFSDSNLLYVDAEKKQVISSKGVIYSSGCTPLSHGGQLAITASGFHFLEQFGTNIIYRAYDLNGNNYYSLDSAENFIGVKSIKSDGEGNLYFVTNARIYKLSTDNKLTYVSMVLTVGTTKVTITSTTPADACPVCVGYDGSLYLIYSGFIYKYDVTAASFVKYSILNDVSSFVSLTQLNDGTFLAAKKDSNGNIVVSRYFVALTGTTLIKTFVTLTGHVFMAQLANGNVIIASSALARTILEFTIDGVLVSRYNYPLSVMPYYDAINGLAVSATGEAYAISRFNGTIYSYSSGDNGQAVIVWRNYADGVVAAGTLMVSESDKAQVVEYSANGMTKVRRYVAEGITAPSRIALDSNAILHVENNSDNKVHRFTTNFTLKKSNMLTASSSTVGDNMGVAPKSVAKFGQYFCVADPSANSVAVYDANGEWVQRIGEATNASLQTEAYIAKTASGDIITLGSKSSLLSIYTIDGKLKYSTTVAATNTRTVLGIAMSPVADQLAIRFSASSAILIINLTGDKVAEFSIGTDAVSAFAYRKDGGLYVCGSSSAFIYTVASDASITRVAVTRCRGTLHTIAGDTNTIYTADTSIYPNVVRVYDGTSYVLINTITPLFGTGGVRIYGLAVTDTGSMVIKGSDSTVYFVASNGVATGTSKALPYSMVAVNNTTVCGAYSTSGFTYNEGSTKTAVYYAVVKYSLTTSAVADYWSSSGKDENTLNNPQAVAATSRYLYIADTLNRKIVMYDATFTRIKEVTLPECPLDLDVTPTDTIVALGTTTVFLLNGNDVLSNTFSALGDYICAGVDDIIVGNTNAVMQYSYTGSLKRSLLASYRIMRKNTVSGGYIAFDGSSTYYELSKDLAVIAKSPVSTLSTIKACYIDADDVVFVGKMSDVQGMNVHWFDPAGKYLGSYGTKAPCAFQFPSPIRGIAKGEVAVLNTDSNDFDIFTKTGTFRYHIDGSMFTKPEGLTSMMWSLTRGSTSHNAIIVCDTGNKRFVIFLDTIPDGLATGVIAGTICPIFGYVLIVHNDDVPTVKLEKSLSAFIKGTPHTYDISSGSRGGILIEASGRYSVSYTDTDDVVHTKYSYDCGRTWRDS